MTSARKLDTECTESLLDLKGSKRGCRHVLGSIKNLIGPLGHKRSRECGNENRTTVSGRTKNNARYNYSRRKINIWALYIYSIRFSTKKKSPSNILALISNKIVLNYYYFIYVEKS